MKSRDLMMSGRCYRVACFLQPLNEERGDRRIVFDHEQAHETISALTGFLSQETGFSA